MRLALRRGGALSRPVVVGAAVGIALFSSLLLVLTPELDGHPGLQTLWVVLALVLLKLPLLGMVWWLLTRRRRARAARWGAPETSRFLAAVEREVTCAADLPDAAGRLASLHVDAWRAAREGDPRSTPEAVEIALRIDRARRREGRPATIPHVSRM